MSQVTAKFFHALVVQVMLSTLLAMTAAAAESGPGQCGSCHVATEPGDPMAALQASPHWKDSVPGVPVNGEGCIACHGESAAHAAAPNINQPDVSFGPRWSSTITAQNQVCLNCHSNDARQNWQSGPHAEQDLTCSNCHDSHTSADPVLTSSNQIQVCGVCHKLQQQGIHDLPGHLADNPPCSSCHNPHGDPHPEGVMQANRSEGCRACHDLQQMMADPATSARANSYHKVMASTDRTCIDCHRGVAHIDTDNFAAVLAGGFESYQINLFYPDQTDSETLLTSHPGAQALRQGRNCRQCHIGEAQSLGALLAPPGVTPAIPVDVSFRQTDTELQLTVSFSSPASSVAVMFDDSSVDAFSRAGCWAACHSDLPGMSRDRGQGLSKYLQAARVQQRSIGRPPIDQPPETLTRMHNAGVYVELWQVSLQGADSGRLSVFEILEHQQPVADSAAVSASAIQTDAGWQVTFSRALQDPVKPLIPGKVYTFGIAIHGDDAQGAEHWVSLPLTVSLDGLDTDFVAGQ